MSGIGSWLLALNLGVVYRLGYTDLCSNIIQCICSKPQMS